MTPVHLTSSALVAVRARALLLADARPDALEQSVAAVGALQAQSTPAVHLALRARTAGLRQSDVVAAVGDDHTLVRTTLMRGTLFLVAAHDLHWMVDLVGPVVSARGQRRRAQLGISERDGEQALRVLPSILTGRGAVPLSDIVAELQPLVRVELSGQVPAHLMLLAAAAAIVCRGPESGRQPTYALVDEWITGGVRHDRDTALLMLAGMYLAARGPATAADFGTWSGLPAGDCRSAFARLPDTVRVECEGVELTALASTDLAPPARLPVRLIGMFDEYLLSHRSRELILDPADAPRILTGGMIQSAVLVDGRIAGTWRVLPSKRAVKVEQFSPQPAAVKRAIDAEVDDVLRFLDA